MLEFTLVFPPLDRKVKTVSIRDCFPEEKGLTPPNGGAWTLDNLKVDNFQPTAVRQAEYDREGRPLRSDKLEEVTLNANQLSVSSRHNGGRTQIQKMEGKRLVRVTFRDKSSFEPVIANLVLTYRTPVNILYADTKNIGGAAEGEMILQLPEIEEVADKMIQYLKDTNMGVEELKSDVG